MPLYPTVYSRDGATTHLAASQAITGTPQAIAWPAPDFDPYGYYSAGSPTKLTVPTGHGGRLFLATLAAESSTPAPIHIIRLNGSTVLATQAAAAYVTQQSVVVMLNDGNYIEAVVLTGSGTNVITLDVTPRFGLVPVGV
jgi:hypothetical protein